MPISVWTDKSDIQAEGSNIKNV